MRREHLDAMVRGWFIGPFEPTALASDEIEVAVKFYAAGDAEAEHHHRVATEVTVIVSGTARMGSQRLAAGDIVVVEPGEPSDFEAFTAVTLVAVKLPAVIGDKHPGAPPPC